MQPTLPPGRWQPRNHAQLQNFLCKVSPLSQPKTAVFDWDNTCIFGDIGEATFHHQLQQLQLRLPPTQLHDALQKASAGCPQLP
ncbi:MAG: hypothetical protein EOO40_11460, partial [Deltaproteobacteria bacterium]